MTIATSYPGVYIKELPSGVRTISNVSTSVTAFVGYTARGLDHTPTTVLSFADFERNFGGLASDSELSYCIKHFFDNGGSQAIVVRVPRSDAVSASVTLKDKVDTTGSKNVLQLTAISKGEWGNNIAVDVDYYSVATETQVFNMTVKDLATGKEERYLNLSMKPGSFRNVESIINNPDDGSSLIRARVLGLNPNRPAETGTVSGDIELTEFTNLPKSKYDLKVLFSNMDAFTLAKVYTDTPSVNNRVVFSEDAPITVKSIHSLCRQFEANINQEIAETRLVGVRIRCVPSSSGKGLRVFADIDPQRYKNYSPFDNIVTFQQGTHNSSFYEKLKLNSASSNVSWYLLGQGANSGAQSKKDRGKDGIKPPVTNDLIGKESEKTGLQALNSVDIFNLLCIPDATRSDPNNRDKIDSGLSPSFIFSAAARICEKKRAFLIVDPSPDVSDPKAAINWKDTVLMQIVSKNSAAYFPRIEVPDPLNDYKPRSHPPCGVIAGLYARTDAERGVWKAPAGTDSSLRGVQDLTYKLDDKENGLLNPIGINCLRKLPTYGSVAWGTRTILGADELSSEWKYVPIRRLALFIEESLYRGTQWIVFEPNDEPLWSQIRLNIGAFMQNLYRQGAFAGNSPREAYEIRCDKTTTTPDDINRGIVNILVKFKPLYPAEFVVIKIQQMAGQTMV